MLASVVRIAQKAGIEILKFYDHDIEVFSKSDDSPLTKADLAAHKYIINSLKELTPEVPIISEESGIPDYELRKTWNRFWLIDPLDGTKEFIKKNDEFTVNIALIENEEPILGVVYAPALATTYFARKGEGAFKQVGDSAAEQFMSNVFDKSSKARIVVSRSHGGDDTVKKLEHLGIEVTEEVPSGSSIKFCLVAEGEADLYPRFGPTMEWDTAAADAVYRYSSSEKSKFSPLVYNKKSMLNPYFIIGLGKHVDLGNL